MQFEQLSGAEKAAVFILSIPPPAARKVLSGMGDDEVERIMGAVSRIPEVPTEIRERVVDELRSVVEQEAGVIFGGRDRALSLLHDALDEQRASRIRSRLGREERRIDWTLQGFDAAFVADALAGEHLQTVSLILSQLPAATGAGIIAALPEPLQADVVLRLADLEEVALDVMADLEDAVADLFGARMASATQLSGRDTAAQIINQVERAAGESILEAVEDRDAELALAIRKRMLTFEDLGGIDDREFQVLLREVPTEDLVVALKTASAQLTEKVFKNVSSRAADQIREDLEMLGPMKLSDVEAVQERVVEVAQRLGEEGSLTLPGGAGDVLV